MVSKAQHDTADMKTILSKGNGKARAAQAVEKLNAYIDKEGINIPLRNGALNLSAICKAIGVGRSTANQNPAFRQRLNLLTETIKLEVLPTTTDNNERYQNDTKDETISEQKEIQDLKRDLKAEQKRADKLEKRLTLSLAQNAHLHSLLKQAHSRETFLTEKGKGGKRS
jgi:hypothetical protein